MSNKTKKVVVKKQKKASSGKKQQEAIQKGKIGKNHPLLDVQNITMKFGHITALKDVSFKIMPGERIGLIGGNGAGKTTVTEIIAGINKPTSGTLTYGFDFNVTPKEGIGMQFQQSTYPSGLTVKDIIKFAINLRKLTIAPSELLNLLRIFQMEEFYTWKVRSLSGGQRQKLNILLSILHNPRLVILDELSTGLDISAREEIINFTDKLLSDRKMSAIVISHHMGEIESLCSKVVVLDRGTVVEVMEIKDIVKKYGSLNNFSRTLISKSNDATRADASKNNNNTLELKVNAENKKKKSKLEKQAEKRKKIKSKKTKTDNKDAKIEQSNQKDAKRKEQALKQKEMKQLRKEQRQKPSESKLRLEAEKNKTKELRIKHKKNKPETIWSRKVVISTRTRKYKKGGK